MKAISSVLFVLLFSCFCRVSAQTSQASAEDRSLDGASSSRQERVEERQEQKKKKKKNDKKEGARFTFADHPSFRMGTAVRLNFEARIESYARTPTNAIGLDQPHVAFASPRFGVTGDFLDRRIGFEVSRDPSEGPGEWKDVFVNLRRSRALELTGGRFKVPFGREMLTGRSNLDFVYRSFAAEALSPGRDVGVMAHGRLYRDHLKYQAGYFGRDGDNARTTQTRGARDTVAARIVFAPFASKSDALGSLELGTAVALSRLDTQLGLRGVTVLGDGVFFDRVYVNGRRTRTGLEALWESGPISLSSELAIVSDQRNGMGFESNDLPGVKAAAWYVAGTWVMTGEKKHGRVDPKRALFQGGAGAFELAARLEGLRFDDVVGTALRGNGDRVTTLGLNWYLNRFVRVQPNLIIESIHDPQNSPAPSRQGRFISGIVRFQFTL